MITLKEKLKQQNVKKTEKHSSERRISIRDKLLVQEVQEMQKTLPPTCQVFFDSVNDLANFGLRISPSEGYWAGGNFNFSISVPEEYNIMPPTVQCTTTIWHPNISESGEVCLSLLRLHSVDGMGWAPTRTMKDVVWGLNSLFSDLLNFEDPLNVAVAEHYEKDKMGFISKVHDYVQRYAKR